MGIMGNESMTTPSEEAWIGQVVHVDSHLGRCVEGVVTSAKASACGMWLFIDIPGGGGAGCYAAPPSARRSPAWHVPGDSGCLASQEPRSNRTEATQLFSSGGMPHVTSAQHPEYPQATTEQSPQPTSKGRPIMRDSQNKSDGQRVEAGDSAKDGNCSTRSASTEQLPTVSSTFHPGGSTSGAEPAPSSAVPEAGTGEQGGTVEQVSASGAMWCVWCGEIAPLRETHCNGWMGRYGRRRHYVVSSEEEAHRIAAHGVEVYVRSPTLVRGDFGRIVGQSTTAPEPPSYAMTATEGLAEPWCALCGQEGKTNGDNPCEHPQRSDRGTGHRWAHTERRGYEILAECGLRAGFPSGPGPGYLVPRPVSLEPTVPERWRREGRCGYCGSHFEPLSGLCANRHRRDDATPYDAEVRKAVGIGDTHEQAERRRRDAWSRAETLMAIARQPSHPPPPRERPPPVGMAESLLRAVQAIDAEQWQDADDSLTEAMVHFRAASVLLEDASPPAELIRMRAKVARAAFAADFVADELSALRELVRREAAKGRAS